MRYSIRLKLIGFVVAGLSALFVLISAAQTGRDAVKSQKRKPFFMTRLYTGADGQTHSEEIEAKFGQGGANDVFNLKEISGAALHRTPAGSVLDWHTPHRRQYVITLSGRGELEVSGGKKIAVEPGSIHLVEDTTGKGHIARVVGTEDRVTLDLTLSDQSGR